MAVKSTPKLHELEIIMSIGDQWPHYFQRAILCTNLQIIQEALLFLTLSSSLIPFGIIHLSLLFICYYFCVKQLAMCQATEKIT
jgi:hypothetical protein